MPQSTSTERDKVEELRTLLAMFGMRARIRKMVLRLGAYQIVMPREDRKGWRDEDFPWEKDQGIALIVAEFGSLEELDAAVKKLCNTK